MQSEMTKEAGMGWGGVKPLSDVRGSETFGVRGAETPDVRGAETAGDCGAETPGDRGAETAGDCGVETGSEPRTSESGFVGGSSKTTFREAWVPTVQEP
jgi:hypothetical protein